MPTFRPNEKQYDNVRNPDTGLYEHDLKLPGHLLYPDNPLHRHHPLQPSGMMRGSEVGYEKEFPPAYPPFPGLQDWGEYGTGSQLIAEVDYERDLVLNTTYNNQDNDIVRKEKLARLYSDEYYGDINAMDLYRSDYLHDRFMSEWYNYNHIPDTPTPRLIPGVFYNLRRDQTSTISWVHSGTVLGAKELLWQNYSGEAHGDSPEPTPEGCGYSKVGINIASGEIRMSLLRTYVKIDLRQFITRDPLGIVNPFININFNDMKFRVQTPTDGQALSLSSRAVGRAYYITSPGSYILVYYENQAFVSTSHWMDTDGNNLTILSEEPVLYTPGSIMEWTLTETAIDLFRQRLQDVMENPLMFNTFFIIGIVVSKYDYSQEDIYPGEQLMLGDDSTFETIGNWAKHELEPSTASVTGGNYDSEEHPHCLRLLGDSSIDTDFSAIFILDSHLQYPIRSGNTILITFDYKWIVDPEQAHANDPLIFFETFLSSVHIDNDHFGCYQELFADPPFGSKEVLPRLSNGWSHDWNRMTKFDTLGVTVPSSEWLENIWTYLGVNFDPRWSHHILITPWVDDFHGHAVLTEPVDPVEVLIDNFRLYNCWDIPTTIISDPNNDEYDGFWWQGGYCFMNPNLVLSVVEPHIPIVITENHIFESDNYVKLGGWVRVTSPRCWRRLWPFLTETHGSS